MNKYIIIFILLIKSLSALGVSAGTQIKNRAYLDFVIDGVAMKAQSNELIDIVDQRLDMNIICQENDFVMVGAGDTKRAMRFLLQNSGNGEDTYVFNPLFAENSDFTVKNPSVYVDNGDGIFSASKDVLVSELKVPADGNVSLYFVADIPEDAHDEATNGILANSKLGDDLEYGESKLLDDYYVLLTTPVEAKKDYCAYKVPSIVLEVEKKATLSSEKLYRGTTIHYEIVLLVSGVGIANDIAIEDTFPEGTAYVEGTLKLDNESAGEVDENGFSVPIGMVTQTQDNDKKPIHTVTFDVRVK